MKVTIEGSKDRFAPFAFGIALIMVGLAVCLLGAGSLNWILEHGFFSAPVLVFLTFTVLGAVFLAGAILRKKQSD